MTSSAQTSDKKSARRLWPYLLLLVLMLLGSSYSVVKGLAAAGLTGTHGTFTVGECSREASTRNSNRPTNEYDCTGVFRSDDGKVVDKEASMGSLGKTYGAGSHLSVQGQNAVGGYTIASRDEVAKNFSLAVGPFFLVPFMLFSWFTGPREPGRSLLDQWQTWRATKGTRTRRIVLTAAAVVLVCFIGVGQVMGAVLTA